jgi:hypothetical protein
MLRRPLPARKAKAARSAPSRRIRRKSNNRSPHAKEVISVNATPPRMAIGWDKHLIYLNPSLGIPVRSVVARTCPLLLKCTHPLPESIKGQAKDECMCCFSSHSARINLAVWRQALAGLRALDRRAFVTAHEPGLGEDVAPQGLVELPALGAGR